MITPCALPQGSYSIIVPRETLRRASEYLAMLQTRRHEPGARLQAQLSGTNIEQLTALELLGKLFDTKSPQIFAEAAVCGNGSDWNLIELGLLGDISVAVPVTAYDDGKHRSSTRHAQPFAATLVFTPGALLRNGQGHTPADWNEVTAPDGSLAAEGYANLYRRRLLPVFRYINHHAQRARSAFVTVPGLGCGQFAGPFRGQLGEHLQSVLSGILAEHGDRFPNLKSVYFDPFDECRNTRMEIHGISFMVRPLKVKGNEDKPQLCHPISYSEPQDDFSGCELFSLVAWDHVSWPGNDFFIGSRSTDDGVKAAASSSMFALTGIEGTYDPRSEKYQPPAPYRDWQTVVQELVLGGKLRLWKLEAIWHCPGG